MKEMYAMISTQNLASNVTIIYKFEAQGVISDYRGVEPLDWCLQAIRIQCCCDL